MRATVEIEGARQLRRELAAVSDGVDDNGDALKQILRDAAEPVFDEARRRAPVRSGALRDTLRVTGGKATSFVRAGFARVPYAGVIHFGTTAKTGRPSNIPANPFLYDAADIRRQEVLERAAAALDDFTERTVGR